MSGKVFDAVTGMPITGEIYADAKCSGFDCIAAKEKDLNGFVYVPIIEAASIYGALAHVLDIDCPGPRGLPRIA